MAAFPEIYFYHLPKDPIKINSAYTKISMELIRAAVSILDVGYQHRADRFASFYCRPFMVDITSASGKYAHRLTFGNRGDDITKSTPPCKMTIPFCGLDEDFNNYKGDLIIEACYEQLIDPESRDRTESLHRDILLKLAETYERSMKEYLPEHFSLFTYPVF